MKIDASFAFVVWSLLAAPALADTCECADMADLLNREAEERAAIAEYRSNIAQWGNSPPAPNEATRAQLQVSVQQAVNNVTTSGTNKAIGLTDQLCATSFPATSACMREVAAQHETVHSLACDKYRGVNPFDTIRYKTLADYALEEIAAYEAEAAYVHANLSNMQSTCKMTLEVDSTIFGTLELAESKAQGKIPVAITAPDRQPSVSYRGSGTLDYKTRDTGPPKKVGNPMLMQLIKACYVTFEGSGKVTVDVLDGKFWRSNVPPYDPRLELTVAVDKSQETRKFKGERGCPKSSNPQPFWSDMFLLDKTHVSMVPNQFMLDGWTFAPSPGVVAEKVVSGACGPKTASPVPGVPAFGRCVETSTFRVRWSK